ncbi:MAG: SDR family NAD(P)-dependent oxidoreductase [Acidimicrobiia bacterium]|jgi:NAD(P)-dependent dehydrogenase (short-subunit alcohol dehydrogenase family)
MESFEGRLAVVTGAGSGMGRELVLQLAAEGCSVAGCDVDEESMAETVRLAEKDARPGVRITGHRCDVSDEAAVERFRDEVLAEHETDHVNLLFNNAGVGGGGSFLTDPREVWERTFSICWGGVYTCTRAFMPLLVAADAGHLVNTSSVNGFWAMLAPGIPHTAYSAAKFAVKGFSEALLEDLRLNAPHVKVSVVMPGHIGTDIVNNSRKVHGGDALLDADGIAQARADMAKRGVPVDSMDDDAVRSMVDMVGDLFRDSAPTSAAEAVVEILDGVKAGRWRILVGDDARTLDEHVRANPEAAYEAGGPGLGGLGFSG